MMRPAKNNYHASEKTDVSLSPGFDRVLFVLRSWTVHGVVWHLPHYVEVERSRNDWMKFTEQYVRAHAACVHGAWQHCRRIACEDVGER
jgi:hypothetical protein